MKTTIFTSMVWRARKFFGGITGDLDKPRQNILPRIGQGIMLSGSLKLSEIIRKIKGEGERIKGLENKISQSLKSGHWNEIQLMEGYLKKVVAPLIKADTAIYIDRGDISKEESRKLEGLGYVWDGSMQFRINNMV